MNDVYTKTKYPTSTSRVHGDFTSKGGIHHLITMRMTYDFYITFYVAF